ncbi:MAG: hypothetical protein QME52_05435 [Bacteroidota bacterium]|nr:hypothetical protein [Bacteroidota bacterium]
MPVYNVTLVRSYVVQVKARNKYTAKRAVEFFLNDPKDASEARDRKQRGFKIGEMEMVENDAIEVVEQSDV